ncbi:MAG: AEC family transporter [Christensenellaceae bacterium]|nr:AEC family transporter [Christensenellaceae bacterium]
MQSFLHSISAVLIIVLLTATGYVLGHLGWFKPEHKSLVSKLVINVALPCLCLSNLIQNFTLSSIAGFGALLLVPFLGMALCMLLCAIVAKLLHLPHRQKGLFTYMGGLPNVMFIGMPLCIELFGEAAVPFVLCTFLANAILAQSIGIAVIERDGHPEGSRLSLKGLKNVLKQPPFVAVLVSLAFILLNVRLPSILLRYTEYLSGIVSPLALIYAGYVIYEIGFKNIRLERGLPTVFWLRFVVSPAICFGLCALFGVTGLARSVFLVIFAMPTMTQSVVLSGALGSDENYAAQGAAITTLLSFIIIPILMLFA